MRLPFIQVTRFRLTLVGNFSNLAPRPEIVIYAAGDSRRLQKRYLIVEITIQSS